MTKRILTLLLIVAFATCKKSDHNKSPCSVGTCTAVYAAVYIRFVDKTGTGVIVTNYSIKNLRTGLIVKPAGGSDAGAAFQGYKYVANDGNIKEFSPEGDDLEVTATDPTTHQTKTVTVKVSGGCNCHVERVSGPEVVTFD